ncbi:MAG: hypothetical protein HYY07_02335 [Elusimicrobia bacterium]|nr:hypothetical protein [Elusimicrobiota bacterium]
MKQLKKYGSSVGIVLLTLLLSWILPPVIQKIKHLCPVRPDGINEAQAVAQFSRKFGMNCNTCHTVFPRLTYFGEKFMRNGFQIPGSEDGDDVGKTKSSDKLFFDQLGNYFGVRLSVTPLAVKANTLTKNGNKVEEFTVGNPDWMQFFVAGSIFKNVSIFIENEVNGNTDNTIKINWFYLGFHNLLGFGNMANVRVGKLPPLHWTSASGRLPMLPPVKQQVLTQVTSSNNGGDDSVPITNAQQALEFYGYRGPVLYALGLSDGKSQSADKNQDKNYWGVLRLDQTEGAAEGSSVSLFGYKGVDTKDLSTVKKTNNFFRIAPSANLRLGNLDIIGSFAYGEDDNWTITFSSKAVRNVFRGAVGQIGYLISPEWYTVVQYDVVDSPTSRSIDFNRVSPSIWYTPRENMRIGLIGRIDLQTTEGNASHTKELHEILVNIRTMF